MGIFEAVVLGAIQGLTEFLPVSSSGHLAVAQHFLGELTQSLTFDIAVHVGTVLSVLTVYFKALKRVLSDAFEFLKSRKLTVGAQLVVLVFLGSIPAAIVGIGFKSFFESLFSNLWAVDIGFIITGAVLFATRKVPESGSDRSFFEIDDKIEIRWWQALGVGVAQAIAIVPGISRSGSTIGAGILLGVDRRSASLFSFMLLVPAVLGAALLELRHVQTFGPDQLKILLVGVVVSYGVGLVGLKVVLNFVKRGRIHYFSYYLWALAIILSLYLLKGSP